MRAHLYIVRHDLDGEQFSLPVVGDSELQTHITEAERFGARLSEIRDMEWELDQFVWRCCFEGMLNEWSKDA